MEINTDPNNENLPEELQKILKDLVLKYEREDSDVRLQQVRFWKKCDLFWHGIQQIFWSESRTDWVNPVDGFHSTSGMEGRESIDQAVYDYVINIYKAHGESIIAALGAQVPTVRFPPDDADNEDDLITSKTFAKIADLIQRHNNSKQMMFAALFAIFNGGNIFSYSCSKADKKYGEVSVPQYESKAVCESCGYQGELGEEMCPECSMGDSDPTAVPGSSVPSMDPDQMGLQSDPMEASAVALAAAPATVGAVLTERPVQTGEVKTAKSRTIIELYGNLDVKVSHRAATQDECIYLIHSAEHPKAKLKSLYPNIAKKLDSQGEHERWYRSPSISYPWSSGTNDQDFITMRRAWLRPCVFDDLGEELEAEAETLKGLFPEGAYVCIVGEVYAESRPEDMDKYWTIGKGGLSRHIHPDPLGKSLVQIQELRNNLVNLTQETIEHGIPSSFADSDVLDFDAFSKHEGRPGMVYPVKPKPGESISNAFFESARATLSKEVPATLQQYDHDAQFCSGAFPSIYGGAGEGTSRTAAEYNMSRQMALQRLSITWSLIIKWWCTMIDKAVKIYVDNMIEDERHVTSEGRGANVNYINVWIHRAELTGKVGDVEAEGADTFPVSTPQKQTLLLKLLELKDEFLNEAIFHTENRRLIADVLAYPDIYIPGEDQRIKQVREIQDMMKDMPIPIEPLVDDDQIHIDTLKNYLVSQVGMDAKTYNPMGYELCLMHLQEHEMNLEMKIAKEAALMAPVATAPAPGGNQ